MNRFCILVQKYVKMRRKHVYQSIRGVKELWKDSRRFLALRITFIFILLYKEVSTKALGYWIYTQIQTICEQSIQTVGLNVWQGRSESTVEFQTTETKSEKKKKKSFFCFFLSKHWINTHPVSGQTWQWLKCAIKPTMAVLTMSSFSFWPVASE